MHIGFLDINWTDLLDIVLVAVVLYYGYQLLKSQVANLLLAAMLGFFVLYQVVHTLQMELLTQILERFAQVGMIMLIIVFQPEIRKFMLTYSQTPFWEKFRKNKFSSETVHLDEIITAAKLMAATHTGAIVVFQKRNMLDEIANKGDILDCEINARVLMTIFQKGSPMHDGAVIIAEGKILSARCILPMDTSLKLEEGFGTRHRAAVSLSNECDAVILIISEERGEISIAYQGRLETRLSAEEAQSLMETYLEN